MVILEFLRGSFAVGVVLVGLRVIGAALSVALDSDDWFFLALGLTIALGVSAAVLRLAVLASHWALAPMATGWLGMAVGRHPQGFGVDDENARRALGNVLLIVVFAWWGHRIWAAAEATGDPFWSVVGVLVVAGGALVGVLSLIPRVYFVLHAGEPEVVESDLDSSDAGEARVGSIDEQATFLMSTLLVCLMAGMGLADCTGQVVAGKVDAQGRVVMPYGDWVFACVASDSPDVACSDPAVFAIRPRGNRARRLRVTLSRSCPVAVVRDGSGKPVDLLDDAERSRLGIPGDGEGGAGHDHRIFDALPGEAYTVEIGAGSRGSCRAGARYGVEPTSLDGEGGR